MAPHSSTLAWKIPWMEEPDGLHGVAESRTQLSDFTFTFTSLRLKDLEFPGLSHRRLVFQKLRSCMRFIPLMLADVIATFI